MASGTLACLQSQSLCKSQLVYLSLGCSPGLASVVSFETGSMLAGKWVYFWRQSCFSVCLSWWSPTWLKLYRFGLAQSLFWLWRPTVTTSYRCLCTLACQDRLAAPAFTRPSNSFCRWCGSLSRFLWIWGSNSSPCCLSLSLVSFECVGAICLFSEDCFVTFQIL